MKSNRGSIFCMKGRKPCLTPSATDLIFMGKTKIVVCGL